MPSVDMNSIRREQILAELLAMRDMQIMLMYEDMQKITKELNSFKEGVKEAK